MRILVASDLYYPYKCGCSHFTQNLAVCLQKRGHDVLIIAPSSTISQGFYSHNSIRVFGVRSFPILLYKNFRFSPPLFVKKSLKKVIREFNPDIIHAQGHFFICSMTLNIAKELSIASVSTNHLVAENITHYLHLPKKLENLLNKLYWLYFRFVFDKFDFVTTPTKTAADILKKAGLKKKVFSLSNGIDLEKFNPNNKGDYLKKQYFLPNKPILLYVGRLDKEKNLNWVLRAFAKALKKIEIHLTVVGIGEQESHLKNLAKKLGIEKSVTFTGFVKDLDLPNMYALADSFIIAGTAELQCLVAMEAMATGLPVLAADALALPELVKDGDNGYLFKPGDIEDISSKMIKMFEDKKVRLQMGKRSLELIQKHEINKTMDEFERIYKSLRKKD